MGLRVPAGIAEVHMTMEEGEPVLLVKWETTLNFSREMSFPIYDIGELAEIVGLNPLDLMKKPDLLIHSAWIAEYDPVGEDWMFDYDDEH